MMRPNNYFPNNYNEYQMLQEMRYFEVGRRFVRTAKRDLYRKLKAQQNQKKRKHQDSDNFPSLPARPVSDLSLPKTNNHKAEVKATTTEPEKKISNQDQNLEAKEQENESPKAQEQAAVEIKEILEDKSPKQPQEKDEKSKEEEPKWPEPDQSQESPISQDDATAPTQEPKKDEPANPKKTSKTSKKKKKPKVTQLKKFRDIIKIFQQMNVLEPCKDLEKHSNLPVIDLSLDPQIEHVTPTRPREYRKDYKRDHYSRKRDSYRSRKTFEGKKKKRTRTNKPGEKISLAKGKYPNII